MRLFATGAMNWVMGKAFPDDMPLEAKMVTKAIERAQRTVEDRNFEIRKDVLKYDEVMNEQRKVIYRRRQQILDGGDLRDEALRGDRVRDRPRRARQLRRRVPRGLGPRRARTARCTTIYPDAHHPRAARRHARTATCSSSSSPTTPSSSTRRRKHTIGADNLREIERRVMLSMIDQHWREHLYEMDYLREGINLRAMGQKDPLAEWQREGFDMFEAMMGQIQDKFVALRVAPPGGRGRRGARARPRPDACATARPRIRCRARAAMRATAASMPADELTGEFGGDARPDRPNRRRARAGVA